MSGSTFGNYFRVTTWGESHGPALGAVVDGCPAGLCLSEADIQPCLDRRKPGSTQFATQRKEGDCVQILSGVFEGKTTGTPISLLIPNTSQRSADYSDIAQNYRPGHADYTFDEKYGFRDYRGGGRSSGRETSWAYRSAPTPNPSALFPSILRPLMLLRSLKRPPACPTGRLPRAQNSIFPGVCRSRIPREASSNAASPGCLPGSGNPFLTSWTRVFRS